MMDLPVKARVMSFLPGCRALAGVARWTALSFLQGYDMDAVTLVRLPC